MSRFLTQDQHSPPASEAQQHWHGGFRCGLKQNYSIQISGVIISEVYTGSGLALNDLLPGPMGLQFSLARIGFDDEKEATSTGNKLSHQILQFTEQGRRTVAVMIILTEMVCELVMTSWGELVRSLSAEALNAGQRATYRWN